MNFPFCREKMKKNEDILLEERQICTMLKPPFWDNSLHNKSHMYFRGFYLRLSQLNRFFNRQMYPICVFYSRIDQKAPLIITVFYWGPFCKSIKQKWWRRYNLYWTSCHSMLHSKFIFFPFKYVAHLNSFHLISLCPLHENVFSKIPFWPQINQVRTGIGLLLHYFSWPVTNYCQ